MKTIAIVILASFFSAPLLAQDAPAETHLVYSTWHNSTIKNGVPVSNGCRLEEKNSDRLYSFSCNVKTRNSKGELTQTAEVEMQNASGKAIHFRGSDDERRQMCMHLCATISKNYSSGKPAKLFITISTGAIQGIDED